jgi:hypothetical protein
MGIRDSRTTHPKKSARRQGALTRLIARGDGDEKQAPKRAAERASLAVRLGLSPRSY